METNQNQSSTSLRRTKAREQIIAIFKHSQLPLSAQDIYQKLTDKKYKIDQVTVYRTLEAFVSNGILFKLDLMEGKFRYELAAHTHHHHAVCQQCGAIADISDCIPQEIQENVANNTGYKINAHRLEFFGICPRCLKP